MLIVIIIFLIAITSLFFMIIFRAWEIKKVETSIPLPSREIVPKVYFRHIEKIVLYLTKYIIQSIVFISVKYWFIGLTKIKKWGLKNWPKVYKFFKKNRVDVNPARNSFIRKTILESKIRIKSIKEKVKREHGDK
jgi:hypothetical protein